MYAPQFPEWGDKSNRFKLNRPLPFYTASYMIVCIWKEIVHDMRMCKSRMVCLVWVEKECFVSCKMIHAVPMRCDVASLCCVSYSYNCLPKDELYTPWCNVSVRRRRRWKVRVRPMRIITTLSTIYMVVLNVCVCVWLKKNIRSDDMKKVSVGFKLYIIISVWKWIKNYFIFCISIVPLCEYLDKDIPIRL